MVPKNFFQFINKPKTANTNKKVLPHTFSPVYVSFCRPMSAKAIIPAFRRRFYIKTKGYKFCKKLKVFKFSKASKVSEKAAKVSKINIRKTTKRW